MLTHSPYNIKNTTTSSAWEMLLTSKLLNHSMEVSHKLQLSDIILRENLTDFHSMPNTTDTPKSVSSLHHRPLPTSNINMEEKKLPSQLTVSDLPSDFLSTAKPENMLMKTFLNSRTGDHRTTNSRKTSKEAKAHPPLLPQALCSPKRKLPEHDVR